MKLHYFSQEVADWDDEALQRAIAAELVPPGCLLGGVVLERLVAAGAKDPCHGCFGPRGRCKGRPRQAGQARGVQAERARLHALFTGTEDPVELLRSGRLNKG